MLTRLPLSGDVACYLASEDCDARDARSLSAAEAHGRAQAWAYREVIRSLPGCERATLVNTGPSFGTRQSRHIVSRRPLAWDEVQAGVVSADGIALGAWAAEWHDRETFASSFALPPAGSAYAIPLGCLEAADAPNLFAAGRTADGDRLAGASLRVKGTAFATGQVAGVAAACVAKNGRAEVAEVQRILRAQGALIDPAEMKPARTA